jgi:uracil-DNA glycosylase
VLLLNTVLTVIAHQPMSHQRQGWELFTLEVVKQINKKETPVVFILWGAHAQQFIFHIDISRHLILKAPHPSPLSAHRGFFGSKPFSKTNDFLLNHGMKPIDWKL